MTGLTAAEIATRLGFTPETARTWLNKTKRQKLLAPIGTTRKGRRGPEAMLYSWDDVIKARKTQQRIGHLATLTARRVPHCETGPASPEAIARLMDVIDQVCRGETWPAD